MRVVPVSAGVGAQENITSLPGAGGRTGFRGQGDNGGVSGTSRDRDAEGRARSARPRDGLGRPLPYGVEGVARQPEGVVRTAAQTLEEAQRLLDAGMPFHAHEVFEDAWKSGPAEERVLWRGLAQVAVGLTHAARGNTAGGARLLRRGAGHLADGPAVHGIDVAGVVAWAEELAERLNEPAAPVDPAAEAPRLLAAPGRR
ncbi:hypothetical protein GCM10014713_01300 [Streptomyces purpureus]|uniref:DUF309 domain-containing protein n=1 Tax=Streptomyces purpureus TaxID=1951 RepID=A0A918LLQ7_9ACTN|nr:hypothetical protein GCM10014713_01300 [Streptomyces purpureus]